MTTLLRTNRSRVHRLPRRATYDLDTACAVLDAGFVGHVAFAIEGQPFIIPTAYWREGNQVYWHGSSRSRMIHHLAAGAPCTLVVTHVDGLVLARSGFHHSLNYRSLVLYGVARAVNDPAEKQARLDAFVERIAPGRNTALRPPSRRELRATTVLGMRIEEGSVKARSGPPLDDEADYLLDVWAGVVPLRLCAGTPEPDREPAGTVSVPRASGGFRHLGLD